jgi:ADP-ribose pyrophosphatase YjhB (NUDIX family)
MPGRHGQYGTPVGILTGWRYCPRCSSSVVHAEGRVDCGECDFVGYANPAPTASALVVDDRGRLLLARRAVEPFVGLWDLPGGYLAESEHPLDALRRELREETALEIEPLEFVGVWMDQYGPDPDDPWTMNMYWRARPVAGELQAADDVAELGWFSADELPSADETAFRNVTLVIAAWGSKS